MQYFFWYYLNTTECKLNNFNIGTVHAMQKEFVWLHEMSKQIKKSFNNKLHQIV